MAEDPGGRVVIAQGTPKAPASTDEAKAAVAETRNRLAGRLARTADHVQLLFTAPPSAAPAAGDGGVVDGVIKTIAVAGQARRVWRDAKQRGLVRRAAVAGIVVAIGAAFATRKRHRRRDARLAASSDAARAMLNGDPAGVDGSYERDL